MKRRWIPFIIIGVFLCITLPVFSKAFRDFFETYNMQYKSFPENYIVNSLKDIHTYTKFITVYDLPNFTGWLIGAAYVLSSLFGNLGFLRVQEIYKQNDKYGSHGTSRWQNKKEIMGYYYKDMAGWFLGSYIKVQSYKIGMDAAYHPVNGLLNMQIVVVGPPGSNKTTGFVLNNIYHIASIYKNASIRPDIIMTDPKSELYSLTAPYLKSMGYDIKVLDFIHLKYGDSINNLDFINDEKELIEIAYGYIKSAGSANSSSNKSGGDQEFWDGQEAQVFSALIGYVKQVYPSSNQTFTDVLKLLTSDSIMNAIADSTTAKNLFKDAEVKGAAYQMWCNFLMIADNERTRANILGGLAEKLKLFSIKGIQNITSSTTIDINLLGAKKDKPIALFILMPDNDRTFMPIINVTISTILKQLYKTAYNYNNTLYCPVYNIWEEMANIGYINGLKDMLGTMRGRKIYPMMIWQSLSQMKDRYPQGWEDILSQCDTHVYLGVNDEFTAKYASNETGDTTISIQGISKKNDGVFSSNAATESLSYHQRKLLMPEECKRMDISKMLISQRSRYPVQLYKVQYKYWESDNQICEKVSVFDLPLIKEKVFEEFNNSAVYNITHDERDKTIEHKLYDKEYDPKLDKSNLDINIAHNHSISELDFSDIKGEFCITDGLNLNNYKDIVENDREL